MIVMRRSGSSRSKDITVKRRRTSVVTVMNVVVRVVEVLMISRCWRSCRDAVQAVRSKAPIGQGRANMALGVVLGQLASMPGLPQKDRADYHDEAMLALQQAVACDPADVSILYNLALVQVSFCVTGV